MQTTAAGARQFEAGGEAGEFLDCLVCERRIPDGRWFARFQLGGHHVAFCRPRCVERFLEDRERYGRLMDASPGFTGDSQKMRNNWQPMTSSDLAFP
jgi:hypothetical protein